MLELTLLGPAHICLNGKPVADFFSSKALILFCYLALEEDRVCARETLTDFLWGEHPGMLAKSNVRQSLHNLQKRFPGYLKVTRTTVAFDKTQPYWVDVFAFRQLLEQPAVTPVQLEAALVLYRGEFLEGLFVEGAPELEAWLYAERERHRLALLAVCEQLAAHYTWQGEWERAKELAQRALNLEPWREAIYRQLMLVLARQGEYNAALAQYEACCAVLDEELGVEPAPETVRLYERIQQARSIKRHNLPLAAGVLVGRDAEQQRLGEWLRDPGRRLITLVGPGGVGKTRLGQELAVRHEHEFLNGVRYVPLGAITRPEYIVTAIAKAVDADLSGSAAPAEQLARHLCGQEVLLLLDGFEHVIAGAGLIDAILQATADVKIIVTSREKLDLRQEWVFAVGGLATPPEGLLVGQRLEAYAAVAYFVQCARRQQDDFALNGQGAAAAELCRALGGSPLGIELAAALLPTVTCAQIMAEMSQSLDVLASTRRDLPERHRSLRKVFEHSWRLLAAQERVVFPRLSVFRGSFTLDAARQVAGASLSDLNGLIAKSLLKAVVGEGESVARYDIHEILRQYAEEMLNSDPLAQQQMQSAHVAYYADFMCLQEERTQCGDRQAGLAAAGRELDNVLLAWQRAVETRNVRAIERLIDPLYIVYDARARFWEGGDLFNQAMQSLSPATTPQEQQIIGHLLTYCSACQKYLGWPADALVLAQQAVALLRPFEAGRPMSMALLVLGNAQLALGEYLAAQNSYRECLFLRRRLGESIGATMMPLVNLGLACTYAGDYETARQMLEEALVIYREQDIRPAIPHCLNYLGTLYIKMKDWTTARHYYEQALSAMEEMGNLGVKARALTDLGFVDVQLGAYEQAVISCRAGLALARENKLLQVQINGLLWLALAQHGLGDRHAANQSVCEGLEVASHAQLTTSNLNLVIMAADLLLDEGRKQEGVRLLKSVACHPMADEDDHTWIQELLAEQGASLSEDEYIEERPLNEIVDTVLFELRSIST